MKCTKWLSVMLVILMLLTVFSGCGSSQNASSGSTTAIEKKDASESVQPETKKVEETKSFKLAHFIDPTNKDDSYAQLIAGIISDFTKKTGIKVELETLPWDQLDSKLAITNAAGETVDLSWCSSQKLASLVNAGALMPLDKYASTLSDQSDFSEFEKKATTSALDGKKYMFLASIHSRLLWYNKNLVPEPPKTWDELVNIGKKVTNKDKGIYGFGFWGSKHYGSIELIVGPAIWSAGGKISNNDGSAAFNSPEAEEAIKFLGDCVHKYQISPESVFTADFTEIDNAFQAGNIAMIVNGSYQYNTYMTKAAWAKDGKIGVAPIPGKNGPGPNFANGWALGIPAKAKNPDTAWEFIKYFESPEVQVKHSLVEGGAPTRKAAWEDQAFKDDIHQFFFDNLSKNGHPMDPLVYYQEGLESLNLAALGYFLDPKADLKKLLDDQATAFNKKYYNK